MSPLRHKPNRWANPAELTRINVTHRVFRDLYDTEYARTLIPLQKVGRTAQYDSYERANSYEVNGELWRGEIEVPKLILTAAEMWHPHYSKLSLTEFLKKANLY